MALVRLVRECDIFRKLRSEHADGQTSDSKSSLVCRGLSLLLIAVLGFHETWTFLTPIKKRQFDIDAGETAWGHVMHQISLNSGRVDSEAEASSMLLSMFRHGTPKKMRVHLDITIWGFPCIDLSLDYQDIMGTRGVDVSSTIFKQRLQKDGTPVDVEHMRNAPKPTVPGGPSHPGLATSGSTNSSCGSCYGALPDGSCCNTCSDVLYAYRIKRWGLPRIEDIVQCRHDGTAKSVYQPPQILHLGDYKSDDFIPRFTKLSHLDSAGPQSPKIITPFKLNLSAFNFSFPPLKPLPRLGLSFDDGDLDDDGFDDFPDEQTGNSSSKTLKWPGCVQNNVIIHGFDIGEALMMDLSKFGASKGCWNDNCKETDKFACESRETCAGVCKRVDACKFWTWGDEAGIKKCWIRSGRHGRERRYGFVSGAKECFPNSTANSTDESSTPQEQAKPEASTRSEKTPDDSKSKQSAADKSSPGDSQPRRLMSLNAEPTVEDVATDEDDMEETEMQPRRLMGLSDDSSLFDLGLSSYMPLFGGGFDSKENELRQQQKGESCRMYGYFDTNKVPGNFHIGTHGALSPSYLSFFDRPEPTEQSMMHTINRLAFVDVATNKTLDEKQPLDGFESPKAFTFQYYITVSPATRQANGKVREGYQFRSGSFVTNELIGPAVYFRYTIDPIRVTYFTQRVRLAKWLTNMCAVVGGAIAISSMLSQLLEMVRGVVLAKD